MVRAFFILVFLLIAGGFFYLNKSEDVKIKNKEKETYWFVLHRKSNTEEMFYGVPGDKLRSQLAREFKVKVGIPGQRPTPLPSLVGREYWNIIKKEPSFENLETAPYFLTLDIPAPSEPPFGPVPYTECDGMQCDWILPGAFGLHGTGGDRTKISEENEGSSGCIRHLDEDITFLYNLLEPEKESIRYYVEDN